MSLEDTNREPISSIDLLILGAGWTSTFLIPLCQSRNLSHAATSRSGRPGTIKFVFDQDQEVDDLEQYKHLPPAKTVLITFPVTKKGASERLVGSYQTIHGQHAAFIQLGTTSIWDGASKNHITASQSLSHRWYDRHSPFVKNDRSLAEEELLTLAPGIPTTVLNLSGLWGGSRDIRNWVGRVAPSKDALRNKGSIHLIHGHDVARAILAVHQDFAKASGGRWLLTDGRVYDWWDLASAWGSSPATSGLETDKLTTTNVFKGHFEDRGSTGLNQANNGPQPLWVLELMQESNIRALPRDISLLGRALDSREFWAVFRLMPEMARLDTHS